MVKNYDDMLSRFHLIPERHGQTDTHAKLIIIIITDLYSAFRSEDTEALDNLARLAEQRAQGKEKRGKWQNAMLYKIWT